MKDHFHLFTPAFGGQAVVAHGDGLDVIVHHHVVVVHDGCTVNTHLRESRPAVVEHHGAAGVIHGVVTVSSHIGSGLGIGALTKGFLNHVLGNVGSLGLGTFGNSLFQLVAVGLESGIDMTAAAGTAPGHAVRASRTAAAGTVVVFHAGSHAVLDGIGIVQHITFSHGAGIGIFVAKGVVMLGVIDHHIGRIGMLVGPGTMLIGTIEPGIIPHHLHITGFAELAKMDSVNHKVIQNGDFIFSGSFCGGIVSHVIHTHLGGRLALKEQGHYAERLGVLAVGGSLNLGRHGLRHGDGFAAGILVLDVHGAGTGGNRNLGGGEVPVGNGLGKNVQSILLGVVLGNGIQNAGHCHQGQCPHKNHF